MISAILTALQKQTADAGKITPKDEGPKKTTPPIRKTGEVKKQPNYLIWVLAILGIAIIILIVFLIIKKRKENENIGSLRKYLIENMRKGYTAQQLRDALLRYGYNPKQVDNAIRSISP